MRVIFGQYIREARISRGWDQAELARRLGEVGQQTVSSWERGASRPQRSRVANLAQVLELQVKDLLAAAGYPTSTADSPDQLARPVRPRVTRLPLEALAADRFEEFIADLVGHLYPKSDVHRFGGQGHKQHGVDVRVVRDQMAEATYQCKRHQRFGPAAVRDAVLQVTEPATANFIVLSRLASPEARKEIQKHKNWQLLDVEDVSRIVRRDLSTDAAVRLVDTYFPGWHEGFLGIPEPGPWVTSEEFFRPFTRDRLFSHEWNLVGRALELESILAFVESPTQRIATLVGRGGIGKTRLLRAVASAVEEKPVNVRFLAVTGDVRPEHYELLPPVPLLLILDDAHDRRDIAQLLASLGRARPGAKVLVALRPYGWTLLTHELGRLGLHTSDFPRWDLGELMMEDAEGLAREILGPEFSSALLARLARLTTDCPLITVLGAGLIKRGDLDPGRLEGDKTVREQILRSYRDALVGDPAVSDPELRRAVLDALAILQPVKIDEGSLQAALEKIVGVPFDRIMRHLRNLEAAGVLLRRARQLRLVPDLLGDVILAEACVDTDTGASTGYIERARQLADGEPLQNLFVNANRLDWQVRRGEPTTQSLVDSLWEGLEEEFRGAGIRGRLNLTRLLQKVALYQPARTLGIVRWALENPTDRSEDEEHPLARLYPLSYADVIRDLPTVLKYCGYTLDHLELAADLLWQLAQLDDRPTGQHPEHPLRVLSELIEYTPAKPLRYSEVLLSAAERWLAQEPRELVHSPFDVLEPLLATEGADHRSEGFTLTFRPYALNIGAVKPLRQRVVGLALREARHHDLKRSVRAVKAIGASLHYPVGLYGRIPSDVEKAGWTPLFITTIKELAVIAADPSLDPVVGVAIHRELNWHARHSPTETKAAATAVTASIPSSMEHELALLLYDGWGRLLFDHLDDFQEAERRKQDRFQALVDRLLPEYSDGSLVELVGERLDAQIRAFGRGDGSPGQFVWTLVRNRPSFGEELCRRVMRDPDSALRLVLPATLSRLVMTRPEAAIGWARELISTDNTEIVPGVAHAFGWARGDRGELIAGEAALLSQLAVHQDPDVRGSMVRAAQVLAKSNRQEAIRLLTRIPFDDSDRVADEVFATLGPDEIRWDELSPQQAEKLLNHLVLSPSIEHYHITEFLNQLSSTAPDVVLRLLLERVEHSEKDEASVDRYQPLPYDWYGQLQVRSHPQFKSFLRLIRDWMAENVKSWRRERTGAEIFAVTAGKFDGPVLAVLDEALDSGLQEQVEAVGAILRAAPRQLIWEEVDFVQRVLHAAAQHGENCLRRVGANLHASMTEGGRSGTPGQPFPEDVEQRDKAEDVAGRLPRGSLGEKFYRSLQLSAEASIRWTVERDEDLL